MADLPTISALWIGGSLTWLERLCLKSWVDAGHPTALYAYETVDLVPEGVETRDANAIVPDPKILKHGRTGSVALFSDLFRFHLMQRAPGEIWIDTDIYCWRRLAPKTAHVFGYESTVNINGAVLRLPPDSEALGQMIEFTADEYPIPEFARPAQREAYEARASDGDPVHVSEMPWGIWGPHCLTHYLRKTGEARFAAPVEVYYPVHFRDRNVFFKRVRNVQGMLHRDTATLHLWAPIKRFAAARFGGYPPEASFLWRRLEHHGLDPQEGQVTSFGDQMFGDRQEDVGADYSEGEDDAVADRREA